MDNNLPYFITIYDTKHGISSEFIRANSHLVDQYSEIFTEKDLIKNQKLLEDLWIKEYRGRLIYNETIRSWDKIEFANNQDMTLFLLKWS